MRLLDARANVPQYLGYWQISTFFINSVDPNFNFMKVSPFQRLSFWEASHGIDTEE